MYMTELTYEEYAKSLSPVGYWRLGESTGPTAFDSSGNASDGTYVNTPTYGSTGLVVGDTDTAVTFTSASDTHVSLGSLLSIDTTSTISIHAIVKPSANGTYRCILSRFNSVGFVFEFSAANKLRILIRNTTTTNELDIETVNAFDDTTRSYVVCVTLSGTGNAAGTRLYVDGVDQELVVADDTWTTNIDYTGIDTRIGLRNAVTTYGWDGVLDEISWFDKVLSSSEIVDLYLKANGIPTTPVSFDHTIRNLMPAAYWKLDETGADTIAVDELGRHDLTYINTPNLDSPSLVVQDTGSSVTFDSAIPEYAKTGVANPFSGHTNGSIIALIKTNEIAVNTTIFSSSDNTSDQNRFKFMLMASGRLRIFVMIGGVYNDIQSTTLVNDNAAHLCVVTSNGTSWKLYIDGVEEVVTTTGTNTGDWLADVPNRSNYCIGVEYYNVNIEQTPFNGSQDQVALFDYELAQVQVEQLNTSWRATNLDFIIDHTKVSEDLYDFPVLVNLDSTSGTGNFDATSIYKSLDKQTVDDNFAGANGDSIDSWFWSTTSTILSIYTETARFYKVDPPSTYDNRFTTKYYVERNGNNKIDVTIDYDISNWVNEPTAAIMFRLGVQQFDSNFASLGEEYINLTNSKYRVSPGTYSTPNYSLTGGLRAVVDAAAIRLYYDNGSGFVWNGDVNGYPIGLQAGATYFKFYLMVYIPATFVGTLDTRLDNFKLDKGVVVWPTNKTPEPSKLLTIYPDSNFNKPAVVNDTFTGTNGDSPNSILWTKIGAPTIQSNKLNATIASAIDAHAVISNFHLSGDFDVQCDWDISSYTNTATWLTQIRCISAIDELDILAIDRRYDGTNIFYAGRRIDGTWDTLTPSATGNYAGKFRLTRTGSAIECFYDIGGGWVSAYTGTWITDDVYIKLGSTTTTTQSLTANTDNFVVNSGSVVWPIYDSIGKGAQECKVEIDRWDSINSQAQIWVKVPYISKDEDTVIRLVADPSNSDNSANIGYTGSSPGKAVWSEYYAVYHLSSNGADSVQGLDGTLSGIGAANIIDFGIGKGLAFNGTDEFLTLPDLTHGSAGELSVSYIAQAADTLAKYDPLSLNLGTNVDDPLVYARFNESAADDFYVHVHHTSVQQAYSVTTAGVTNKHNYDFTSVEGTALEMYIDGVNKNIGVAGAGTFVRVDDTYLNTIGKSRLSTNYMKGNLKEIRLSKDVKTDGWIAANNESIDDTLSSFAIALLAADYISGKYIDAGTQALTIMTYQATVANDVDSYIDAGVQALTITEHNARVRLLIQASNYARYLAKVTTSHLAKYGSRLVSSNKAKYGIIGTIQAASNTSLYAIKDTSQIVVDNKAAYSIAVSATNTAEYAIVHRVITDNKAYYADVFRVISANLAKYVIDNLAKVRASNTTFYTIQQSLPSTILAASTPIITYATSGSTDTQISGASSSIAGDGGTPVTSSGGFEGYSPLAANAVTREADIFSFDLSTDEGGFMWKAAIVLSSIPDYAEIEVGDEITLVIGSDTYLLVVDSKSLDRSSPVGVSASITAVSPVVRLTSTKVTPYTYTWDYSKLVSKIAEEVAAMANLTIAWDTVDWLLPENLLSITEGEPIQLLIQLAEAAGATLESNPDGSLVVRPIYRISPPNYTVGVESQVYTDEEDKLSISQSEDPRVYYNSLEIGSASPTTESDSIEFIPDENDSTKGELRVYLNPWRSNVVLQDNTGVSSLSYIGVVIETVTEEYIEVVEDYFSVSKPVYSLNQNDVVWHSPSLGAVSYTVDDNKLTTSGVYPHYGLLSITYETRYLSYMASGANLGDYTQYILIDNGV